MKKTITIFAAVLLAVMGFFVHAQDNLLAGWNANLRTGTGTEANKWGWASSYNSAIWVVANSTTSNALPLVDVTHKKASDNTDYKTRLMRYRWDANYWGTTATLGTNDGTSTTVKGIALTAGESYTFSGLYEWWSNGLQPTYSFSFSDSPEDGKIIASTTVSCPSATQKTLHSFSYNFKCSETGVYYLQIKQTNGTIPTNGTLIGLADLSLKKDDVPIPDAAPVAVSTGYKMPVYATLSKKPNTGSSVNALNDGSLKTCYKSAVQLPDTIDFYFINVARLDSMIYMPPTSDTPGGEFGATEIYYSTENEPDNFIRLMDYDFGMTTTPKSIALNGSNGIIDPSIVRVIINSARNNYAACAEMKFKSSLNAVVPIVNGNNDLCELVYAGQVLRDTKQAIQRATATSEQSGFEIEKTFDDNSSTYYNTQYNSEPFPVTIDYYLVDGVDRVDYLLYTPRPSGDLVGAFQETEIWYTTTDAPNNFVKLCDYNFNTPTEIHKCVFPHAINNPAVIRIVVKTAYSGRGVAFAEMEFFKKNQVNIDLQPNIFKDDILSWIKPEVTQTDIDNMSAGFLKDMAQCMFNNTYDKRYRLQEYEPYPNVVTTANNLRIGTYSQFENPTGIYFTQGTTAVLFVDNTQGQSISLKTRDYASGTTRSYPLSTGVNFIPLLSNGLGYISYYTDNYAALQPVKIHIATGKINRYYDVTKNTAVEWRKILTTAVTEMIDLKGRNVGLLYPVSELRKYSALDAKPLMVLYDSIVKTQWIQMGLVRYNRVPKNHMFAEADTKTPFSWYAGSLGAHFGSSTHISCDQAAILDYPWGVAHEFGHVNQIRPGLKWGGTTEVTNNIYSAWMTYLLNPRNSYLEARSVGDGYYNSVESGTGSAAGNTMYGGRFNSFLNNALMKKQVWMYQYGTDCGNGTTWETTGTPADHFVKLVPLWQLELYYQVVSSNPAHKDWFKDLAERVRNTNYTGMNDGRQEVEFMKNVCDIVGEDLSDFFRKVGMLRTLNREMRDYGTYQITITAADSTEVANFAARFPRPATDYIYYLSKNSVNAYRDRLPVEGGNVGDGCTYTKVSDALNGYQNYVTVDNSVWRNVAVFKTYQNNDPVRLSMVGGGYLDNERTRVYYPTGATSIYAVAWDGTETLVYGTALGLANNHQSLSFTVMPNPVKSTLQVSGFNGTAIFSLTDLAGKQVLKGTIKENETIAVDQLHTGVYMITLTTKEGSGSQKVIKK